MKSTSEAIALLAEIQNLMQLKGENPFKVRAYEKAQKSLEGHTDLAERARAGTLTEVAGIGKGISEVLTEFLLKGKSTSCDELRAAVPPGLVELSRVPGLGPKKAQALIEKLGIQSLGELEYACRENRLLGLTGFGVKLQAKILEGIQFLKSTLGQMRLGDVSEAAQDFARALEKKFPGKRWSEAGALRRRVETLTELDFAVEAPALESACAEVVSEFKKTHSAMALPVRIYAIESQNWGSELARRSSTPEHWRALGSPETACADEADFYKRLDLPWIAPEFRETGREVELARGGKLDAVLPWNGIQGIFHNHTTRSDGVATLEEMVIGARDAGFRYIGISDHSQSAVYAQGLKDDALEAQHREIQELQERYPDTRIFWGIESDILADGSLDYPDAVLKRFDFVIASVHSRFQMDRSAMTERLLTAVRNPRTTMLGHWSGRLLLGRKPYEFDCESVIKEAAKTGVAIEINANPQRLDIDWRWGDALRAAGTLVAVNPDAHEVAGIRDTLYGVGVARKALLPRAQVINARDTQGITQWLQSRK